MDETIYTKNHYISAEIFCYFLSFCFFLEFLVFSPLSFILQWQKNKPIPLIPNRGHLDPASNWLQFSSDNDSDPEYDQFLLNANDMYSDDAWSSCSDLDTQGNNTI